MKKHWYYGRPGFFRGLALLAGTVIIVVPLWTLLQSPGCNFYFGSQIVDILNQESQTDGK